MKIELTEPKPIQPPRMIHIEISEVEAKAVVKSLLEISWYGPAHSELYEIYLAIRQRLSLPA